MFQQHSPLIICLASALFVLSTHATALPLVTNWRDDHTYGYYYLFNYYNSHLDRVFPSN